MKKSNNINILTYSRTCVSSVIAMMTVGSAFAQSWRYDGPAVDYNFISNPPAQYQECEQKYTTNPLNASTTEGALRIYRACDFGVDESRRMAERFGGGNGRIQGYLRGYAWGLFKGVRTGRNDAESYREGQDLINGMGDYLQRGLEDGKKLGNTRGAELGAAHARSLFESAVSTGRFPELNIQIPAVNYEGEDNGYSRVVGKVKSEQDVIREAYNANQLPVYSSWNETYMGEVKPLRPIDLWFADGVYVFPKAYWFDPASALQTWKSRPIDTKPKFEALNNPAVFAFKTGPDGKPMYETVQEKDAQGNPVFRRVIDPVTGLEKFEPVMITRQVLGNQINLQSVFDTSFRNSYEWYVNYEFSKEFFNSRDEGMTLGESVGLQVGKRLAQQDGLIRAFDERYKQSTKQTYAEAFAKSYEDAYRQTYDFYSKNPVLSARIIKILGADNAGILQPGEAISIQFAVKNAGGVASDLRVSASGRVTDTQTKSFQISALDERVYTAEMIAKIDPRVQNRERITINLQVNGITVPVQETVQRMVQILAVSPRLDATKGKGEIAITLKNVATIQTPGTLDLKIESGTLSLNSQNVGYLTPGATNTFTLDFDGIDPLTLIREGIDIKVTTSMQSVRLDDSTIKARSASPNIDLVRYFNQVANNRGIVPAEINIEDRLSDLTKTLIQENHREAQMIADGSNLYRDDSKRTILGSLVNELNSTPQTEDARYRYDYMGSVMYESRKLFGKFLFFKSAKRSAYEGLCNQLSRDKGGY